ncbi:hypothetical protein DFP73DRAFT_524682 [Morchella snyderi]|nr:hypothetical protein DFP73DRAFT_524682 [Morchella snyderi]
MASNADSPFEPFDVHNGNTVFMTLDHKRNARAFHSQEAAKRKTTSILSATFVRTLMDTFKAQPFTRGDLLRALMNYDRLFAKLYHYYTSLVSQAVSLLSFYFPEGSPSPPATLLGKVPNTIAFGRCDSKCRGGLPPDPAPGIPQEIVLLRLRGLFASVDALNLVMDEVLFRQFIPLMPVLCLADTGPSNIGFRVASAYTAARCEDDMDRLVGAVQKWLSESNINQYESILQEVQWLIKPDSMAIQVSVDGYRRSNSLRRRRSYHSN